MRALSGLGIALAIISSLLFLALISEIYYIFWWKKRFHNSDPNFTNFTTKFLFLSKNLRSMLCFKNPINSPQNHATPLTCNPTTDEPVHLSSKDSSLLKASINGEETVDAELMRLHSLSGPPRFLFTIKEETREDLESDDGRSRGGRSRKGSRGRSLGDLLHFPETPFLTPLSSPPLLRSQNLFDFDSFKKLGFNPLFESSSSPPPKLKFLKDAEEKLQRSRLMEGSRSEGNGEETHVVVVGKSRERGHQVTPLPSSPLSSIKTER